jgi:alkylhydroperoxidase/carboxymuconolactone decarboxylase family protein YurZ
VVRLTAAAEGSGATTFISDHWHRHLPAYDRRALYVDMIARLSAGSSLRPGLLHMTLAAVHGCLQRATELRWHIAECYRLAVPEAELAEALSYVMFSGSVPYFIEACAVWQSMVREGAVPASAPFRRWAELDQAGPG